ncbi:MAG: glycosyltransferase family 4 protein [Candidatus Brocadiia bacterium]
MEKPRVLIVADTLDIDSPSVYAIDLAQELCKKGSPVMLVCSGSKTPGALDELRATFDAGKYSRDKSCLLELPGLAIPFISWFSRGECLHSASAFKPDVIHATGEPAERLARFLAHGLQVPYFVTYHRYWRKGTWSNSRDCFGVIAVSNDLRENLVNSARVPKDLISVIPNGIQIGKYFADFRSKPEDEVMVVGTLGKLIERKGHIYLIKAAAKVLEARKNVHFLLAGDGPLSKRLRDTAIELGIANSMTFSSYPFRASSVIREMDIYVLPSVEESLGFTALEALAYGRPVVAFGTGGVFEFLKDGETGLVVPIRDVDALAAAIVRLLDDAELRLRLARKGRALVEEKFSISKFVDRLTDLYGVAIVDYRGKNVS